MKKEITILQLLLSIIVMFAMGWLLITAPKASDIKIDKDKITHETERISTEILVLLENK